jgi:hypothetical protein
MHGFLWLPEGWGVHSPLQAGLRSGSPLDLAIDSHDHPSLIRLLIKQSKTDPFREAVEIFLGATSGDICPVRAMVDYLSIRPATPGPLFLLQSGSPLTRASLVANLQEALRQAGLQRAQLQNRRGNLSSTERARGLSHTDAWSLEE